MVVLGIAIVIGAVALVLVQAISSALHGLSDDLPQIVDKVRHSDLGNFINSGSDSLDTLRKHASDITGGVGKVSGGVAHVGVSALGAVTLGLSVIFLTLSAPPRKGPDPVALDPRALKRPLDGSRECGDLDSENPAQRRRAGPSRRSPTSRHTRPSSRLARQV